MGRLFNICNIYTFLWCLYSLQGALYERGSRLSQYILLVNLSISFYLVIRLFSKERIKAPYLKGVMAFLLLGIVYGVVRIVFSPDIIIYDYVQDRFSYLKVFLISFLPIFVYYYFSYKGYISEQWVKTWFFIFLGCALISFLGEQISSLGSASLLNYVQEQRRTTVGYKFVLLLPALAFFYKNSYIKYGLTVLIIVLTFFALKRGAIVTVFVASIYMVWQSSIKSRRNRSVSIIIAFLLVLAVFLLFRSIIDSNVYFQSRFSDTLSGDASGREDLYPMFLDTFLHKSDFIQQLFGHGANGTVKLFDVYAHNDWLELAIDTGILGVVVYLFYWISLFKSWRIAKKYSPALIAIGLFGVIEFTRSLFSMSYENLSIFSTSVLAYSIYITGHQKIPAQ